MLTYPLYSFEAFSSNLETTQETILISSSKSSCKQILEHSEKYKH